MALIIKKKKSVENVLDNEQQENIAFKPIPIVLQNDYDGINNDKINGIKNHLKVEMKKLENMILFISDKNWKYDNKFAYDFLINLEFIIKNISEIYYLKNYNKDLTISNIHFRDIISNALDYQIPKSLKFLFDGNMEKFYIKDFRNNLAHFTSMEDGFEILRKAILKKENIFEIKKDFQEISGNKQFLLDKIFEHISTFSKVNKDNKYDFFLRILELKESIYHISVDGKIKYSEQEKLDPKKFPGSISVFYFINTLRNELLKEIIERTNKLNENLEEKVDFKIKAFITTIDIDKIKNGLNSYIINLCELELKNNNKISNNFITKVLDANFINPLHLSKEDREKLKKLPSKLEHNIVELNVELLSLASEKIEDKTMESYKEAKELIKDIKEEQISDSYYSFYRSIINRIDYFEQQNGLK